jgi:hypothetical protein
MAFMMRVHYNALRPAERLAEDYMRKLKNGAHVWVTFRRVKSPKQMALYFAVLHEVFDNLPERYGNIYASFDVFRKSVEIECGFGEPIHSSDGELIGYAPRSLTSVGQDDFDPIFKAVVDKMYGKFLPEIGSDELTAEVDRMLADRRYEDAA